MRWQKGTSSENVEDRRGQPRSAGFRRGASLGVGGIGLLVIVVVAKLAFNVDIPLDALTGAPVDNGVQSAGPPQAPVDTGNDELKDFMTFVFNDQQDTWKGLLEEGYRRTRLVIFADGTDSACGPARSEMGPFYCPADEMVYLDFAFFRELDVRFGAPGDFAQAYVIGHEVGHHLQHVMGTNAKMRQAQEADPSAANELSVRLELQADCYAGVWAHSTRERRLLEAGDVEEGLRAAASIGDDKLQREATGRVRPERFTHGTSEQRARWLKVGLESGDFRQCDTFAQAI